MRNNDEEQPEQPQTKQPEQEPPLTKEQQQKQRITELEEELGVQSELLKSMRAPPLVVATCVSIRDKTADVVVNGGRYEVAYDPKLKEQLTPGKKVTCSPANNAIVAIRDDIHEGRNASVRDVLEDGRVEVQCDGQTYIVGAYDGIKRGDAIVVDPSCSVIIDNLGRKQTGFTLETVPEISWNMVGGLEQVIEKVRDAVEAPFANRETFARYNKRVPRGMLFYGPPGCGKTLLAKALAYNLALTREQRTGTKATGHFLHVKGPEILNKWLGESEAAIRRIFAGARETSAASHEPVVVFIDEADAIFKRRGTGISTDVYDSIVPQFLAEMDGLDNNYDVLVALATNREDILDPALLRPGRVDRKFEIPRPNQEAAAQIYRIHLKKMPLAGMQQKDPLGYLAGRAANYLFAPDSMGPKIAFNDGTERRMLYKHLASGALIEGTVQRAAGYAIKRELATKRQDGIMLDDLTKAIDEEFTEMGSTALRMLTDNDLRLIRGNQTRYTTTKGEEHGNKN